MWKKFEISFYNEKLGFFNGESRFLMLLISWPFFNHLEKLCLHHLDCNEDRANLKS